MFETLPALVAMAKTSLGLAREATGLAKDIKGLSGKPDDLSDEAKDVISALLDRLITLQTEQLAMQSTIAEFEEEKRRHDRFQAERERYRLAKSEQGSIFYEIDPAQAGGDPPHCICAACYDKSIKSVLQPVAHNTFECATCRSRVFMPDGRGSGILVGEVRRQGLRTGFNILDPYGND